MAVFDSAFPLEHLLPKKETGATSFLTKFPNYDGRGTVIAIFDSGVDPRAPGLQVTSDGKPKIIDRYDGTGSGDVITTTVVEAKNGFLTGLSGRQLKIPSSWANPSGQYHLGLKSLYELYPQSLRERISKEYKENQWDPRHKLALAEATRSLQVFEANNPNPVGQDKLAKEDLEAQIEMLNTIEKKFNNPGPALDCIVFHTGEQWRVCLDTSFEGDLESCQVLGMYKETRDFGTLSDADQLNYSVNVYNDGNLLEIVTLCSSHGTHVACIAAACFPDNPEKNGLAPGAQIVSITIGDNRLGSMETGTALVRAMIRVLEQTNYKVDIINMSYGEHAHWTHSGRLGEIMTEVVNKYGVIWVVSGSNHGPALSTVGSPPMINAPSLIGIGAYVSPEMMTAEYSLREKLPGMAYTWSSRGPALDGSLGISVCTPGGAITSVANFLLRGTQLMNGTSMAAPHATGTIALLLSGLKARKIGCSPFSIKRAIENTALYLDHVEPFAQGHGLLQVDRAFEHLVTYHEHQERDVRFNVIVGSVQAGSKGIYMRDVDTCRSKEFNVTVEPFFLNNEERDPTSKIQFNMQLSLTCNCSWVQIPKHLDLMFIARGFSVKVDPAGLSPGVHYTSVKAFDVSCPEKGPVFELPITVLKPEPVATTVFYQKENFRPGDVRRHIINVPKDATWAVLRVNLDHEETETNNARFVFHSVQLVPHQNCKTVEFHKLVDLHELVDSALPFAVQEGRVLELCVTKWWASLGTVQISYSLSFHGISSNNRSFTMHAGQGIMKLELTSGLANEEAAPVVALKHQVQAFRPIEYKVVPLGSRDLLPVGRQIYELQLTYNFNIAKATEVIPNCGLLSDVLYESEYESQLWMIFDTNKQFIASGDAYPAGYTVKLEKGDYTLRLHVRHEKKELLDKIQDVPILIGQKLAAPINMDVYGTQSQALVQGKKLNSLVVKQGSVVPIYIAPLSADKSGKAVTPGQYYSGTITFAKDELGKKVDSYPFKYVLVEPPKKTNGNKSDKENDKTKTKEEEMSEAIRDLKIGWISKLENSEAGQLLYEEMRSSFPDHLPVYIARLQALDNDKDRAPNVVIEIADKVIKSIDTSELLEYYGLKSDTRPDAAKIKSRMDKQKTYLLEALTRKGLALCQIYNQKKEHSSDSSISVDDIMNVYNEILKYVESSDPKVIKFSVQFALLQSHYGRALRLVNKQYEEKPLREFEEKMIELFAALKWIHCEEYLSQALPLKYPPAYRPF